MKKLLLIIALFTVLGASKLSAQDYSWAVGVRGGFNATGITVKHNFDPANSVEGIISFDRGVNVFGLYERNVPVIAKGFNFIYGVGGNVGSWEEGIDDDFTIGVDGIVGLEYKFNGVPLTLTADYKPNLNLVGQTGFYGENFALSIRVTF